MRARRRGLIGVAVILIFLGAVSLCIAQISVNIGIGAPPPPTYVVPAPPPVVVIPGTYVYFAPGLDIDILFYQGYWFRPHGNNWYRARSYNGPWGFIAPEHVPHAVVSLPPDYRHIPPGHQHIPYGQMKKNWGKWERERYWDTQKEWHEGQHSPHGERGPEHHDRGHDEGGHGHGGHGD
jgi:hypothetical protein